MANPEEAKDVKWEGSDRRQKKDRRSGEDRRQGDRRDGADERRTGISVSRSTRRPSFLDHPWWVAGTIVVGIVVGMGVMSVTDWFGGMKKVTPTTMTVLPGDNPASGATATPASSPGK